MTWAPLDGFRLTETPHATVLDNLHRVLDAQFGSKGLTGMSASSTFQWRNVTGGIAAVTALWLTPTPAGKASAGMVSWIVQRDDEARLRCWQYGVIEYRTALEGDSDYKIQDPTEVPLVQFTADPMQQVGILTQLATTYVAAVIEDRGLGEDGWNDEVTSAV